jgi:competence protein ComEA
MRNSEFFIKRLKKLKSLILFLTQQFALPAWSAGRRISHFFSSIIPHPAIWSPHFSISQQRILFALALIILASLYFRFAYYPTPPPPQEDVTEIVVEIVGAVRHPGVYLFQNLPTLEDAIERAGNTKESAIFDKDSSEIVETGTLLTVVRESPQVIRVKMGRMEAGKLLVFSIPLDLNQVTVEDLCLVPGIGESLAREMVTYRKTRKRFRSLEELKNVKGIGEKKYLSFRSYFVVKP